MEIPMLPIGVSNFEKLVKYRDPKGNRYLFVDKTLFIKDYIYSGDEVIPSLPQCLIWLSKEIIICIRP